MARGPISSMKIFKKVGCRLCMMERVHILKAGKVDGKILSTQMKNFLVLADTMLIFTGSLRNRFLNPALMKPVRQKRVT